MSVKYIAKLNLHLLNYAVELVSDKSETAWMQHWQQSSYSVVIMLWIQYVNIILKDHAGVCVYLRAYTQDW